MAKDKTTLLATAAAITAVAGTAAAEAAPDRTAKLYLLKPWTTGSGTTYPAHVEGEPPLEFDFDNLPEGVDAGAIDFLITSRAAESEAMRASRLRSEKRG